VEGIIYSGDVQIMSAGSGIRHSEYNASHYDPVNFLQIWVFPNNRIVDPGMIRRLLTRQGRIGKWQVVVSPKAEEGGVAINQDARLAMTKLPAGKEITFSPVFPAMGYSCFRAGRSGGGWRTKIRKTRRTWDLCHRAVHHQGETAAELLAIEVPMFA